MELVLTLEYDHNNTICWWIDAAFAVHSDFKSHTGGVLTMGKGSIYASSTKQKLNTKSSTEAELVAVDNLMPQILWTKLFLEKQGFKVKDNIIHQDNLSTMRLENNGRGSSGKKTRHINIRYYFITDRIKKGDMRVMHCPTDMLVGDFYTKPLQGKQFRIFQNIILNLDKPEVDNYVRAKTMESQHPGKVSGSGIKKSMTKPIPQECVGHQIGKTSYKDVLMGQKPTMVNRGLKRIGSDHKRSELEARKARNTNKKNKFILLSK